MPRHMLTLKAAPAAAATSTDLFGVDVNTDRMLIGEGFNSIAGRPGGQACVCSYMPEELVNAGR